MAKNSDTRAFRARAAAGWLGLAASPTLALMAWITATDGSRNAMCSPASGVWSLDAMALMYLLMCVFHLSPWLRLASGRSRQSL